MPSLRTISFRARLLLLLLAVSLVQASVAAVTFYSLQSKPAEQRIEAQLNANVRAAAPLVDQHLRSASARLRQLAGDTKLQRAITTRDDATTTRLLATPPAGTDAADLPQAYLTDATGRVVAGTRPTSPVIDVAEVTSLTLRQGAQLIGTLHVPVALDAAFINAMQQYGDKGLILFAGDAHHMVTTKGVVTRPAAVREGLQTLRLDGASQYALVQPVLDQGDYLVGAALPSSVAAAQRHQGRGQLVGFIVALLGLMVLASIGITRSVGGALRRFAQITAQLAGGQLNRRIPVTGNDEVAVLSQSFNEMAEHLEQRMTSLVDARARMRRQVDLFGEALANATAIDEMLQAVCQLALESTNATLARFWTIDDDGRFEHSACIGLRPHDDEPCGLERSVVVHGNSVSSGTSPYWMVVPARASDKIIGLLTLVSTRQPFAPEDAKLAERLGVQAAVAIDNARLHEMLREQATRDGLTGLPNHRSLQDELSKQLAAASTTGAPVGVALLDIDNFKSINDTYGHKVGDEALIALARVLQHTVGDGAGFPGRLGGEEFVVILPGCDVDTSVRIADRIREEITRIEVPLEDGGVLRMSASFGVANSVNYARGEVDNATMLEHADLGLYNSKRTGKNRVSIGGPGVQAIEMSAQEQERLAARARGEQQQYPHAA